MKLLPLCIELIYLSFFYQTKMKLDNKLNKDISTRASISTLYFLIQIEKKNKEEERKAEKIRHTEIENKGETKL